MTKQFQYLTTTAAAKKAWLAPDLAVMPAGDARNTANPLGSDGAFSMGS